VCHAIHLLSLCPSQGGYEGFFARAEGVSPIAFSANDTAVKVRVTRYRGDVNE
jgi:hypothetical protein